MRKIVRLGCVLLLIVLLIWLGIQIALYDEYWNNFREGMKQEFPVIKKIGSNHVGPRQYIKIYSDEYIDLEQFEEMLVYIMRDIEEGQLLESLKRIEEKKSRGGAFNDLVISNINANKAEFFSISFIASISEQYQVWRLQEDGQLTGKEYHVKDYIK